MERLTDPDITVLLPSALDSTSAELQTFMESIEKEPLWFDFFYTEITTGLRKGEICGLKWCDLDSGGIYPGTVVCITKKSKAQTLLGT